MTEPVVLTCVGTGDAFGSGGRLNSCFHLATAGGQILLDCGCSSLIGLHKCGIDPAGIDAVVISHLHGDHFGGIPFLLLEAKYVSQRDRPLALIGPAALQQQVEAALNALYPGVLDKALGFPLRYRQLDPAQTLIEGGFAIRCWRVKHGNSQDVYGLRVAAAGKIVSYTGDTEWTENLIPLAAGSDLLIAECFVDQQPTPSHLDYQTLLQRRADLQCKRLLLTHLNSKMLARRGEVMLEIANDGDRIVL